MIDFQSPAARLYQLLEYVQHLEDDPDIKSFAIPEEAISAADLDGLPGVRINPEHDEDLWLQVQRLHPSPPPKVPTTRFYGFIKVEDDPARRPVLDRVSIENSVHRGEGEDDVNLLNRRKGVLDEAETALNKYMAIWAVWSEKEMGVRRSIRIYDQLFAWRISLAATTAVPREFVAGIGMLGWQLPDTKHEYLYQLITAPLEIVQEGDTLQVRPRDVAPGVEFSALLAQESISQIGTLRGEVKAALLDGRRVSPFDPSTYSDVATAVVQNLHPHGRMVEDDSVPAVDTFPMLSYRWALYLRDRTSTILKDDIAALQQQVMAAHTLPEQPLSMVMPPSAEAAAAREPAVFRGRSGIEGVGSAQPQELYFPLPYNREQITIIDELTHSPGVAVQGPPGTGKTHTIANIVCHYLAEGKRVLVTAEKAHVLNTVQGKIPAAVRPLVVSRVGSEDDGRRQLQSSIDSILQELTQMKPTIIMEEIQHARHQIDYLHQQMTLADRRINEIAHAHFSEIEVDGVKQRAGALAEMVVSGVEQYGWFDDELTLDVRHAPPLSEEEGQLLRRSRRNAGANIAHLEARVPPSASLPDLDGFADLHQTLCRISELEQLESRGALWSLHEAARGSRAMLQSLVDLAGQYHDALAAAETQAAGSPWIRDLRLRLRNENSAAERAAAEALLPEAEALVKFRGDLLARPVAVPEELHSHPKFAEALARAAETGKPFGFFSFPDTTLKRLMGGVTVAGLPVSDADGWAWVQQCAAMRAKVLSFATRHNQFSRDLGVPDLETRAGDLSTVLKTVDEVYRVIGHGIRLARDFDEAFARQACAVFASGIAPDQLHDAASLSEVRRHIQNHLARIGMEQARARLVALRKLAEQCSGSLGERLRTLAASVGTVQGADSLVSVYKALLEKIREVEHAAEDLRNIRDCAARLERAGAGRLAARLRKVPADASGDDPVFPATWRAAWTWARVRSFLEQISDRSELLRLSQSRRELEAQLAKCYEEVSTKQAWLSLKGNASQKVMSALARYKVAVQKIGKGMGKGAIHHRKEAQSAMYDAAEAIPCWIMTQFQVSETMPAKLGMFDLIIIDEASQSTIDALPVLMRGNKVLIVGDDKQVSPSNVGLAVAKIVAMQAKYLVGQPRASSFSPNLSLYDIASQIYPSQVMLLEHFRCHPAIISYSNKVYYDGRMRPLRVSKTSERLDPPLVSIYTPEGVRSTVKSQSINRTEAAAIVAEIGALLADPRYDGRTIGVVSLLGPGQANLINTMALDKLDVAELQRREFQCGEASSFQGAERDIVFLSMVATPEDCHALTRTDHQQRFNVAASRARERMYLVHSVTAEHLSQVDLRNGLLQHFSNPTAPEVEALDQLLEQCDSGFERDMLTELFRRGFMVRPQVPAGGFRIDMVVEGEGDARLAIECDGDAFHGPDRWPADMARQRSLERAGWVFWRCFASTWTIAREETLAHLLETLEKMGIRPHQGAHKVSVLCESRVWRQDSAEAKPGPEAVVKVDATADVHGVNNGAGMQATGGAGGSPKRDGSSILTPSSAVPLD